MLAILAANYSRQQRARGKKSRGRKSSAEYRRNHVNLFLRYVVDKRYRKLRTRRDGHENY